jgi:hypothetical protein
LRGNASISDYFVYAGVFLVFTMALLILENYVKSEFLHACLFIATAAMVDVLGKVGNMTSVVLYCFAAYLLYDVKNSLFIVLAVSVGTFFIRAYLASFQITLLFNELVFRAYIFLVYHEIMHPRPANIETIEGLTKTEIELVQGLINGYSPKELQGQITEEMSVDAVYKRLQRLRERMGATSNEQMIWKLSKTGRIRQLF